MCKMLYFLSLVIIFSSLVFSQAADEPMYFLPQSELIDPGPVKEVYVPAQAFKGKPTSKLPAYLPPPGSGVGVPTNITGYWDFQSNGGAIEFFEVSPINPNHLHAILMVATDSGAFGGVVSPSRRTAYNYSSDGGETWSNNVRLLNNNNLVRSGYPQMAIELFEGNYVANVFNHATHPSPNDPENPLATTINLQQGFGEGFADCIYAPYQFDTNSPIWPMGKVANDGSVVVVAGRQSPQGGTYSTVFKDGLFQAWNELDPTEGGARTAMAISASGKIAAGWFDSPDGIETYTISFRVTEDNGLTWGPKQSITKEPNGYVRWEGFDMTYVGERLFIVSMGGEIIDGRVPFSTSRIRIWDSHTNTSHIVMSLENYPFLATTMRTTQSNHTFPLTMPSITKSQDGTRLFVLADAFLQDIYDDKGYQYSDILYTYSNDYGRTWRDPRNLTRTFDVDERYSSLSNFTPNVDGCPWIYFTFQEDLIPGTFVTGENRPVSKASLKFMRLNTCYEPVKDLILAKVDVLTPPGNLHAVDVPATVRINIKNDGSETNPAQITVTWKGGSYPANENDGNRQVFNTPASLWTGPGNKYISLEFTSKLIPKFHGRDTTVFVRIFYTGDEDLSTNDGKRTISILPAKDIRLSYVDQVSPTILPKSSVTSYIQPIIVKSFIENYGGLPTTETTYDLRYTINTMAWSPPTGSITRPAIAYAKNDSVSFTYTPSEIGTYNLNVWTVLAGDAVKANDTIKYVKLRAYQSNSFSIAYDDSDETYDSMWGVDSARYDLTSGVRFTAPRNTKLLSAEVMFTSSFRDTLADSIVVGVRSPGANNSSSGAFLWKKTYTPGTIEALRYMVQTTTPQWISFPIDQDLSFSAGQDFWITISVYLRPALKTTGRNFPQCIDYYAIPMIEMPENRSFFSENYGTTWYPLREDYHWVPPGPRNRIAFRNLIRAVCLDNINSDQVSVSAGWNMVSIPVRRTDSKATLFPTAISNAFIYKAGSYQISEVLTHGSAYWLKFPAAANINIFGGFVYNTTVDVTTGWNMIGSVIADAPVSGITTQPAGIVTSQYWGYSAAGYGAASVLKPGKGYWVKVNQPGKLTINAGSGKIEAEDASDLASLNSIKITDNDGNSQMLYFGKNPNKNFAVEKYDLPPSAPVEILDARFASNRMVETYPDMFEGVLEYPITINTKAYPVTIEWNFVSRTAGYYLTSEEGQINLSGQKGSAKLNNASSVTLHIDSKGNIPTEFALGQNYPNPFNPSTKFEVALPKDAKFEVVVYDILGSKVATIFDGVKEAGYHTIEWNGMNSAGNIVPSGIYFVKMTAEGFTAIRKALMLK